MLPVAVADVFKPVPPLAGGRIPVTSDVRLVLPVVNPLPLPRSGPLSVVETVNVPLVVIGEFVTVKPVGIERPTLVTYESAGMSAATRVRNVGVPAEPFGAAKIVFAASLASVAVSVPLVVTGELETVKIDGIERPTLVTVPFVAGACHVGTPPTSVKTFVFEPGASVDHVPAAEV